MSTRAFVERREPYWKRAHHDWRFWFAMVLMFLAIGMYVTNSDLALVSR
jgi:hypothetical protein